MQYSSTFATKIKLNRQNNVANVLFYLKKKDIAPFGEMRTELFGMIPLRSILRERQYETANRQNNVANDNFSYSLNLECDKQTDKSLRKRVFQALKSKNPEKEAFFRRFSTDVLCSVRVFADVVF